MQVIEDGKRYELRILPIEVMKRIEECFLNTNHSYPVTIN
jgi:hypothetical protein